VGAAGIFRFKPEDSPFRSYTIAEALRRNELYEQYGAVTPAGIAVGLKYVLPAAPTTIETLAEAARVRSLRLVDLIDFGRSDSGDLFLVTGPVERTLRQRIGEGPLGPDGALDLLSDLLRALVALAGRTPPPLFISPDNVILLPDGARLDDHYLPSVFGAARPLPWSHVAYAAPEADQEGADLRGSLYSVGAVVFEALTGRPPFAGTPFEVIAAVRTRDADLSLLPEGLRPLFAGLLARSPEARHASPGAVLERLAHRYAAAPAGVPAEAGRAAAGDRAPAAGAGAAAAATVSAAPDANAPGAGRAAASGTGGAAGRASLTPLGRNPQGYEEFRREPDGAVMVKIPGGTVRLGSESGSPRECPVIEVAIPPFLIDRHPVTWGQFLRQHQGHSPGSCGFCDRRAGVLPSAFLESPSAPGKPTEIERNPALNGALAPDHPVICVTFLEAEAYARSVGARLPMEAEWETAYRAGSAAPYYWGEAVDPECAWFAKNSGGATHPVGQRRPNGAGLLDMAGNVSEYCQDAFVEDYYARVARGQAGADDLVVVPGAGGGPRSARNGGWSMSEKSLTATFRVGYPPDQGSNVRGFRCAIGGRDAPDWARAAFEGG
jgi:formylglycine-generating enzyme required for sulfatase activity